MSQQVEEQNGRRPETGRFASSRVLRPKQLIVRIRQLLQFGRTANLNELLVARTAELAVVQEKLQEQLAGQRVLEAALAASEQRLAGFDEAPVGIWATDRHRRLSFLNKTATDFAGKTKEEVSGNGWIETVHPDDRDSTCRVLNSAMSHHSNFRTLCRMRRADGQYRWILHKAVPHYINRMYVGHIGVASDISGLKRCHEQVLQTQKIETLGALAAGIAHDFNNLLGGIFAESDLALAENPPGTPVSTSLLRIKDIAIRASEIVVLLREYAGGANVLQEEVDLSVIVAEMLQDIPCSISPKIAVNVSLDPKLPLIRGNAGQLRRVLANLLTNASEALDGQAGVISIRAMRAALNRSRKLRHGQNLPAGSYIRLEVSDTGCGIAENCHCRVFDPFYTTKFLGRGLGLAAADGIIRSHGGSIDVFSKPGAGSRFEVLLPCAAQ